MNIHVIIEEFIVGPSASETVDLISTTNYRICKDEESVTLTFNELRHLKKTFSAIVRRDKRKLSK